MNTKQHYAISRYETSDNWHAAIQPADRRWILFVATDGSAHLYHRVEHVAEATTGDTLEHYVLAGGTPGGTEPSTDDFKRATKDSG